jgi:hypothetical protein
MRIGLDFDGTIADTNAVKSAWIKVELGMHVPPYLCDRTSAVPIIGEENYRRMREQVYSEKNTSQFVPVAGLDAALTEMSRHSEFVLVTARGNLRLVRAWLKSRGFLKRIQMSDQTTNHQKKLEVCFELGIDLLVDDDSRHLPSSDGSIHGILFKPGSPRSYRVGDLPICRSWEAVAQFAILLNQRLGRTKGILRK